METPIELTPSRSAMRSFMVEVTFMTPMLPAHFETVLVVSAVTLRTRSMSDGQGSWPFDVVRKDKGFVVQVLASKGTSQGENDMC